MTSIRDAIIGEDRALIRELFWEYLEWANSRLNEAYDIDFDIESMLELDMAELEIFLPPCGRLLLAVEGDAAAGIACMRRIRENAGEIKRMYVRPRFRRRGIGRALVEALIAEAREIGFTKMRLDSTRFMAAAHSLYRSMGFHEIEPYAESEIPPEFQQHWVFMERQL
ncbi:MAG: GNAT family N-acetyltransferase [Anaerolineae bacterium]|jgi:GNAT superfamily N-acetyltransferase